MTGSLARLRSILIRGLAVVAVVLTYAVGSIGTQLAAVIGLAAVTSTPAEAGWWRGRYRRGYYGYGGYGGYYPYRRRWARRRWW